MSRIMNSTALPSAMEQKLRQIRWRQTLLALIRALAIAASVLLVAMMLAMILDWSFTLFSTGIRTALTGTAVVLAGLSLAFSGFRPLRDALRITQAASSADGEIPQLEERWTTVTSFAKSKLQPTTPTGRAMLQQVTSEAVAMGRLVQPTQVARPTAVRPAVLMLCSCGLVLAAFLAINWPQTSILLQRFWSPTADITATQLTSRTGSTEVPRGESLDLVTELSGVPRSTAVLELTTGDEFVDRFELVPDEHQATLFTHQLNADEPFRYRVLSGDGQTPWHTVNLIDHPSLSEVQLTITAPEYVNRPVYEKSLIPARIRVIQGSRLELLMKPASPLEQFDLALTLSNDSDSAEDGIEASTLSLEPDAAGWYRFETQLADNLSFQPVLLNAHGLTNEDALRCRIQVVPDKAPFARVISPTDEMAVAFDDVIEIRFEAHDDHGIAAAELVVYEESDTNDGNEPKILRTIPIPLGDQELEKHVMADTQLDLKQLGVKEGTNISYAIRVTDTRMLEADRDSLRKKLAQKNAPAADRPTRSADETDQESTEEKAAAGEPGSLVRAPSERSSDDPKTSEMKNMVASADRQTPQRHRDDRVSESDPESTAGKNKEKPDDNAVSAESDVKPGARQPVNSDSNDDEPRVQTKDERTNQESEKAESDRQSVSAAATDPADADPQGDGKSSGVESTPRRRPNSDAASSPGTPDRTESDRLSMPADGKQPDVENSPTGTEPGPSPADTENPDTSASETTSNHTAIAGRNDRQQNMPDDDTSAPRAKADSKTEDPGDRGTRPTSSNGTAQADTAARRASEQNRPIEEGPPRTRTVALTPQQSESGQDAETKRRKLKITKRLTAIAAASGRKATAGKIRDRVVRIDEMLADVETGLTAVVERNIPDADRGEQFRLLDQQLGDIETYISDLRNETKEQQFAFVGLQMVHISRTHVTPARDRTYIAIREPLGTDNPTVALHHVVRAREMLAALLKRYDRVARDEELAQELEEKIEMYEVLVERSQQLMREARQNHNPLKRKMAVIEVDQDYLDRYAEVVTMRREMLTEFGRMLGEDPRLLSRYLDIVNRRRQSLRNQLSEIAIRQEEITTELSNWMIADDNQRADLWMIIAELRMHAATPLAKEAAGLAERIQQTMPLILRTDQTTPALVIAHAQKIARLAREITFDRNRFLQQIGQQDESFDLLTNAEQLCYLFGELDAALEQLNFENEDSEETAAYVTARLLDSRTVADLADAWAQLAGQLQAGRYAGLAEVDQQSVALLTELLRIEMLGMEDELNAQFQQTAGSNLPGEIADMIRELHRVMEAITFNQAAATFAATRDQLATAEAQEIRALDGFDKAGKLFDQIRRAVVRELDQYDVDDPNIADLRDPTLDEFLARLEREPNIEAQLGIPNRPRNLRVLSQAMTGQQNNGGDLLSDAREAARRRARKAMQMVDTQTERRRNGGADEAEKSDNELTEEERQERERARQMQETLEKSLASIREKIEDPQTTDEQRRKLEEMAANMQRLLEQSPDDSDSAAEWERIVESQKAEETLKALASGRKIPDSQWNKLLSTLDDGIWQVGGRSPPEDYRKAIERYQERIRKLMSTVGTGAE